MNQGGVRAQERLDAIAYFRGESTRLGLVRGRGVFGAIVGVAGDGRSTIGLALGLLGGRRQNPGSG